MTPDAFINVLELPTSAYLNRRVPKKLLLERSAPTSADKRILNDGVEELIWHSAIKPTTAGIPEYRDATREYLEIAVMKLILRPGARMQRIIELIHRAVPYPILLIAQCGDEIVISGAHKRNAQNEAGKVVLDGEIVASKIFEAPYISKFLGDLTLKGQPAQSMLTVYTGWIGRIVALTVAALTGNYAPTFEYGLVEARRRNLSELSKLLKEIETLKQAAQRTTQMSIAMDLNMKIKKLENDRKALLSAI
jgi:hypothetical protein